jgi:hypothetical protein
MLKVAAHSCEVSGPGIVGGCVPLFGPDAPSSSGFHTLDVVRPGRR